MLEVPLTQGKYALIDNEDLELVMRYKWCYIRAKSGNEYAVTMIPIGKKQKQLRMHILIMGKGESPYIDHKNNNGIDNRKENLRFCTPKQNRQNSYKRKNSTSVFKGVCHDNRGWRATICENGKCMHLGYFKNEIEAANAYNEKAKKLHGDFYSLNNTMQEEMAAPLIESKAV